MMMRDDESQIVGDDLGNREGMNESSAMRRDSWGCFLCLRDGHDDVRFEHARDLTRHLVDIHNMMPGD